jgi:hypothetical protein
MVRRFEGASGRERWDEDHEESQRETRDPYDHESQFGRSSGDARWGTGGMPVEGRRYRSVPSGAPEPWPARRSFRESPERRPLATPYPYVEWEPAQAGPYVGRGPRGYRRSDERILEDVCERFTEHGQLDPTDVEVTARGGEVVLSGTVATRGEKRLAEDIADLVFGVVEVHNRLRVQRPGEASRPSPGAPATNGTMER